MPGEEVLHQFQVSREESKRLKDIEERLLAIKEEEERISQALVRIILQKTTIEGEGHSV